MSETNLGQLVTGNPGRDAIHIAVAPMVAGEDLQPGKHVRIEGGRAIAIHSTLEDSIGIVDPFLKEEVKSGQTFWLCLYPKTITSLRHEWVHPAFENPAPAPAPTLSKMWLEDFATRSGLSYDALMKAAQSWIKYESYASYGPLLESQYVPAEFWEHYQAVTGESVPETKQQNFFTCSC